MLNGYFRSWFLIDFFEYTNILLNNQNGFGLNNILLILKRYYLLKTIVFNLINFIILRKVLIEHYAYSV